VLHSHGVHVRSTVVLSSFDGGAADRRWEVTNDPVMGGESDSTFKVVNKTGVFDGINKIVPSLKAPGMCTCHLSDQVTCIHPCRSLLIVFAFPCAARP
jgi:hypothetical protein